VSQRPTLYKHIAKSWPSSLCKMSVSALRDVLPFFTQTVTTLLRYSYQCLCISALSFKCPEPDSAVGGRPRGRSSSPARGKNFLLSTTSIPVLGPTQPPIQWVLGSLSLGAKKPGHEADNTSPTSAEVKKGGSIHPLACTSPWRSAQLVKHRDNFTLFKCLGWTPIFYPGPSEKLRRMPSELCPTTLIKLCCSLTHFPPCSVMIRSVCRSTRFRYTRNSQERNPRIQRVSQRPEITPEIQFRLFTSSSFSHN
jgi:hypothetical protein